jgi:hypothetical protein
VETQNVDNMENPRKSLKGLVKPGAKLKARKIDFNDPEVIEMLRAVREEQKKCLERKKIDPKTLDIVINI